MTENTSVRSARCRGCFALGSQGTCNYIFIMEHRRPCPPGAQCTARMTRKELSMRKATWDTELGRKMWAEGKKDTEIASTLGIPTSTVTNYRLKHWAPARKKTTAPKEVQPVAVSTEETQAAETEDPPEDLTGNGPRVPVPETHAPAFSCSMRSGTRNACSSLQLQHDEALPPQRIEIMDVLAAATEHLSGIRAVCTASAIQSLWFWRYPEDLRRARDTIDYLLKKMEVDGYEQ